VLASLDLAHFPLGVAEGSWRGVTAADLLAGAAAPAPH